MNHCAAGGTQRVELQTGGLFVGRDARVAYEPRFDDRNDLRDVRQGPTRSCGFLCARFRRFRNNACLSADRRRRHDICGVTRLEISQRSLPAAFAASISSSGISLLRFGTDFRDTQTRFALGSANHPKRGRFRDNFFSTFSVLTFVNAGCSIEICQCSGVAPRRPFTNAI